MSPYWSAIVQSLTPYVPGEQPRLPNLVKLNTNENPSGPSPKVIAAIQKALGDDLRLYPDPTGLCLREAIAAFYGSISAEQVFVGNGSDEVLGFAFPALLKHARPVLFPDIGYSFYPVYCQLWGIEAHAVPLREDFTLAIEDYRQANGGIVFANPNAPTGRMITLADIERLLNEHRQSVVLVDEAYVDFALPPYASAVGLVPRYPNLLVVQTFSKSRSLAGLRVGFAIGQRHLIEALERVKDSFNSYPLDRLALAGAVAALEDRDWFERSRQTVIANRAWLQEQLAALGFEVLPSQANFVFARHPRHDAAQLAASLREHGVIVRHFRTPARIAQFLRITIGSREQCQALVQALQTNAL